MKKGDISKFVDEKKLVEYIYTALKIQLPKNDKLHICKEGALEYILPNAKALSHKSDILIEYMQKKVSIEVKYKSAVTDQFKCRAYDMIHLKQKFDKNLYGILIFIKKSGKGISIEQAKSISYPFDFFYGKKIEEVINLEGFRDVSCAIQMFLGFPSSSGSTKCTGSISHVEIRQKDQKEIRP